MRTPGGWRVAAAAATLASFVSACAGRGTSPLPETPASQSSSRHVMVFMTPTPAPTATPGPNTLATACGGDCRNIRLLGALDIALTKRPLNPKMNDAAFSYDDIHGFGIASCDGFRFYTGDGDDDFSRMAQFPFTMQVAGPTFFYSNATTLANPCAQREDGDHHGDEGEYGDGDHGDGDHGDRNDNASTYYIAMIGFSSSGVTFQALSGPAQQSGTDLVFPASQNFASMTPGPAYAFFLVRNTGPNPLPTPAPSGGGGGLGGGLTLGG
ncbi:MAG: hypothetical protein JO165_13570 [Candidatus Eremiobacteraeota bacterium]|nr:hypothetical protein [Candidatus Eremiobacteraeota bacterium]